MNYLLLIAVGLLALTFTSDNKEQEPLKLTDNPKRKKYSKSFILAAGKWLKENKVPEEWDGSKLEYALEEMPFEGEVYE